MPGKKKGFFAVLSGCFTCSFYEEQRRIFRLVSLTILYVFRCCPHGCISFLLFPKKGKFMLHFLPHCVRLLRHLLALTAHFWLACLRSVSLGYVHITYAWWLPWRIIFSSFLYTLRCLCWVCFVVFYRYWSLKPYQFFGTTKTLDYQGPKSLQFAYGHVFYRSFFDNLI